MVKARTSSGKVREIPLYSGYYALVIGCSDYRNGWPYLPNGVKDAREVALRLRRAGWQVDLLENPTGERLGRALDELIVMHGRAKDRAVMLWYSGHGYTLEEADGTRLGYLVPVDAPQPSTSELDFLQKAVDMPRIETVAKRVRARHVLMLFDSCFSGAIFAMNRATPSPYIQEKIARPVREFITSGREDEQVPDRSVFKTVFLQAVFEGDGDLNQDGYVTGEELGAYLQEKVVNYSRGGQHPQYGKINNPKLDKGDFVFVAGGSIVHEDVATSSPAQSAGRLRFTSVPSGAVVYVDGERRGVTPLTVSGLKPGVVSVRVEKEGYIATEKQVRVKPGRRVVIGLFLDQEKSRGWLTIRPDPSDAKVRILNIKPKYRPGMELSPGRYHIEVSRSGYKTVSRWIDLGAGDDMDIEIRLERRSSAPSAGSKVYIDGGYTGKTPFHEVKSKVSGTREVLFYEGFENYSVGTPDSPWKFNKSWGDVGRIKIVDSPTSKGNLAVKIEGKQGWGQGIYYPNSLIKDDQQVYFDIYLPEGVPTGKAPGYFIYAGIYITFYSTGDKFQARWAHKPQYAISGLLPGKWYTFLIDIDWNASTFTLSQGSQTIGPIYFENNLAHGWANDITLVGNNSATINKIWIDEIKIFSK
ncbi:Polysaccharide deacetylase, caspase activity [Dissulfuribacter thermophilus]|uniref:Polysaccharide deacetylase, caspase activity n=1 Tax=Dissulfuribacter thermophilus TaxID=1156395 RepID=A0A1B9F302_9BACT|nr:PEGA domain-containing protein [Dissulfuribacter thermophilus]OCC14195.1 Polysaccharide deacetylase, caspase activity [Dissulfuribacter thermophilus]